MNKVILIGRLTKDPEVKLTTANQTPYCNFTVACDRRFKDANGERQADFINCVAWRQQASFVGKYFHKGNRIAVVGSLQTRSYDDNNGVRKYVTEVVVDEVEFVESASSKGEGRQSSSESYAPPAPKESAQSNAPKAPNTPIDTGDSDDDFGGGSVGLPFEI